MDVCKGRLTTPDTLNQIEADSIENSCKHPVNGSRGMALPCPDAENCTLTNSVNLSFSEDL